MATISFQRSKEYMETAGWMVGKTEYWNQWAHKRFDLFGLADMVCVHSGVSGTTYVQSCGEDVQPHIEKMLANTVLPTILKAQNQVFLQAWRKRGDWGKRKTWQLREIEFKIKDGIVVAEEIPHVKEDPAV
jgi:hypothetical protein